MTSYRAGGLTDITYEYAKARKTFGSQPLFCEQATQLCDNIVPNPRDFVQYVLRNPVHQTTQCTPTLAGHSVNTIRAEYTTTGTNHAEGGWPREVQMNDEEATQRYRRRFEKDDAYISAVMNLSPGMEHFVRQNNAIEMYYTYFSELNELPKPEESACYLTHVFRDGPKRGPKRPVSSIGWEPGTGERIVVSYVLMDLNRKPRGSLETNVFNLNHGSEPECVLQAASPVVDVRYHPRDVQMVGGGRVDGVVCGWDVRAAGMPAWACPQHVAHRDLVRSLVFIPAKTNAELFSAGAEGVVKWWDLRKLDEPTDQIVLHLPQTPGELPNVALASGCTVLEFEPTMPSRYMVGTENGMVIGGNRKGKSAQDKLPFSFQAHLGPLWALERNPFYIKNFLSVGDWSVRMWSDDCRESAILWSAPQRHNVTHATWSPTRVSLLAMTQRNGRLSVWDLLRRQYGPILTTQVSSAPLLKLKFQEKGKLIACGAQDGKVSLFKLSPNLVTCSRDDKGLTSMVFERESARERILEQRLREIKLKLRQQAEEPVVQSEADPAAGDRDLAQATFSYHAVLKREFLTKHLSSHR